MSALRLVLIASVAALALSACNRDRDKAAPDAASADLAANPPGGWLLEHVAWTEAESRISAVNADAEVAGLLDLDQGAACLVVDRRTWRGDEHVTRVRQVFPGEAYDLVARFGPGQGD